MRSLQGADKLTTYTFNTQQAKHTFCSTCGVQSFYQPRSNTDGYGIKEYDHDDELVVALPETVSKGRQMGRGKQRG